MNIIHQHKTLIALPPRCATRSIGSFFRTHYDIVDHRGESAAYQHTTHIPKGTEDYEIMMTIRNPYFRYLSWVAWKDTIKEKINRETLAINFGIHYDYSHIPSEKVNYWVRTENIAEDILQVPFILSDYKKGKVNPNEDFSTNRYKSTYNKIWIEDLYEYAPLIYNSCKWVFDKFGYSKNSYTNIK